MKRTLLFQLALMFLLALALATLRLEIVTGSSEASITAGTLTYRATTALSLTGERVSFTSAGKDENDASDELTTPALNAFTATAGSMLSLATQVVAEANSGGDNAAFKSQSLTHIYPTPPHMEGTLPKPLPDHIYVKPGTRMSVSVEMTNNGTADWTPYPQSGQCNLIPIPDGTAWGGWKGVYPNVVLPGSSFSFNFSISAPGVEQTGGYHFQWQMYRSGEVSTFGGQTPAVKIHVDGTLPTGTASFPSSIPVGQPFTITGTSTDNSGQDNSGVYNVWVSIDGSGSNATAVNGSWEHWSYTGAGLAAGSHTAILNITDRAGNLATSGYFTFTNTAPPLTVPVKAPATGTLKASANPCTLAPGETQCATTISWQAQEAPNAQVWYSKNGGSPQLFACGLNGEKALPGIQAGHVYRFFLYPATSCDATPIAGSELSVVSVTGAQPAVGLNKFDLFLQYLGRTSGGDGSAAYQKVTQAMARKAIVDAKNIGVTYFRIAATGYGPVAFNRPGDLDLWRSNPNAYWNLYDQMMNDLNSNGVRIIPVFIWNPTQFPAMAGETVTQVMTDPNSKSYQLLTSYIADFINHYKNHPMLYFYELTNELSLGADLDIIARCLRGDNGPYPELCPPMGNFSTDQMIAFTSRLAAYVRSLDSTHLISSGFSIPRASAEHIRRHPEWRPGGPDYTLDSLAEFQKNLVDINQGIDIVSVHFYQGDNERFGITGQSNAELLGIIKQASDALGKQLFVGEFGDTNPTINQDPNAPFTQSVLSKIVQFGIPYSAPWAWEFYQFAPYLTYDNPNTLSNLEPGYTDLIIAKIKQANQNLGNSVPGLQTPDTTPPQVVLTWPLAGSRIAASQLVHVVASDNNGTISKVEFWVDGNLKATNSKPPYQFNLDTTTLISGQHQITAKAYDPAGNLSQDTINVVYIGSIPTGTITANPNPCFTGPGQNLCSTTISWRAFVSQTAKVWVSRDGNPFTEMACTPSDNVTAPWIALGSVYEFRLHTASSCSDTERGTLLATVSVRASNVRPVASVSAASYNGATLASESIVAAFGTALATTTQAATTIPLPTSIVGTAIKVKDSVGTERFAPLFFVSPSQVNYQIPLGTATGATTMTVTSGDGSVSTGTVQIATVAPGLFAANASGQGVAAALALRVMADNSQTYEPVAQFDATQNKFVARPIDLGPETDQVFLLLFGTGVRFRSGLPAASVKIGSVDTEVLYAGAQGDFVGLDQINVRVPRSLVGRGEVDIAITVDGKIANVVRVNIR